MGENNEVLSTMQSRTTLKVNCRLPPS
uniref:Uncharacterized protein n=1 Tax=Anguilla anguilla TaxID=7936 RepID=A0A0E9SLC2_ANGAN